MLGSQKNLTIIIPKQYHTRENPRNNDFGPGKSPTPDLELRSRTFYTRSQCRPTSGSAVHCTQSKIQYIKNNTICQHKIKTSAWKSKNLTIIVPKQYHTRENPRNNDPGPGKSPTPDLELRSRTFYTRSHVGQLPAPRYIAPRAKSGIS